MIVIEKKLVVKLKIESNDWDILIILDACRYDIFSEVYHNYFPGSNLKKIKSKSTDTEIWVNNMFLNQDCADIIYITPIICIDVWLPKHNLFKIVKSWEHNRSEEYGAVMPKGTNKTFYDTVKKHKEKRYIVHYEQPHTPYVEVKPQIPRKIEDTTLRIKHSTIKSILFEVWSKVNFPDVWLWYINQFLMIKNKKTKDTYTYFDQVYDQYGWDGIRKLYTYNLQYALKYVKELVEKCPDKSFVITADHGEYLGEHNKFGHKGKKGKEIEEIPWLKVGRKHVIN